jgi:hypothetical protein
MVVKVNPLIRHLLEVEREVIVYHFYREANQHAHTLANYDCSMDYESTYFEACPPTVSHLLFADIMKIVISRLIFVFFFRTSDLFVNF